MEGTSDVRNVLEEVQMELIKNSMLKLWLEDFYNFCQVRYYCSLNCITVASREHRLKDRPCFLYYCRRLAATRLSSWEKSSRHGLTALPSTLR